MRSCPHTKYNSFPFFRSSQFSTSALTSIAFHPFVLFCFEKVHRCKDSSTHDISKCMYWHTDKDRRRNPFEMCYASLDCPYLENNEECPDGPDSCKYVHSKLEKMFHPEVYKRYTVIVAISTFNFGNNSASNPHSIILHSALFYTTLLYSTLLLYSRP